MRTLRFTPSHVPLLLALVLLCAPGVAAADAHEVQPGQAARTPTGEADPQAAEAAEGVEERGLPGKPRTHAPQDRRVPRPVRRANASGDEIASLRAEVRQLREAVAALQKVIAISPQGVRIVTPKRFEVRATSVALEAAADVRIKGGAKVDVDAQQIRLN